MSMVALTAMLSMNTSAHASNIIADGGFESAGGGQTYTATSSVDGGSWIVTEGAVYIDNQDPFGYAGNNAANLTGANPNETNAIEQVITTTVGDWYVLNFWGNSDTSNTLKITENGTAVAGAPTSIADGGFPDQVDTNGNSSLFTDYTGSFQATSTSTTLLFTANSDLPIGSPASGSVVIDNVSVQTTPEPGSIVLLLTGIAGLGLVVRKKRLAASVSVN
jgi:hypothetical protein